MLLKLANSERRNGWTYYLFTPRVLPITSYILPNGIKV